MDDPSPATIDADVPCSRCGYNLRTLPGDGSCPECGRGVAESAWRYEVGRNELGTLRLNDIAWRQAMCRGLSIAVIAWGMAFCGALYTLDQYNRFSTQTGIIWLLPHVVVFAMSYWAAWVLATPRLGITRTRVMRIGLLAGLVAPALLFMNERFLAFYFNDWRIVSYESEGLLLRASRTVGRVATISWPLLTALTFTRITHLAWLSRRRVIAAVVAIAGLAMTGANGLIAVILNSSRQALPSSGIIALAIGPTGTNTLVWGGVVAMASEIRKLRYVSLRGWDIIEILLVIVLIALTFSLGFLYWTIRSTITRSIRLSQSLDASCPTSPAPRLPAGSR